MIRIKTCLTVMLFTVAAVFATQAEAQVHLGGFGVGVGPAFGPTPGVAVYRPAPVTAFLPAPAVTPAGPALGYSAYYPGYSYGPAVGVTVARPAVVAPAPVIVPRRPLLRPRRFYRPPYVVGYAW